MALPTVSVIVVNWNGEEHLADCFSSLLASDYPAEALELVMVDNGSTDGSLALVAARFPTVRVVPLDRNHGFTGGNNRGVAASSGDVLVFLNNDMRVDPGFVRALVSALDDESACAAARVLSWDGRRIDFVRGTASFEARGFQEHYGKPYRPELAAASDTFSPNGGAFAIRRSAYTRAGGFDDRFFAYYDDLDLGWRLRLFGHRIRVAPDAVAYHRHGATSRRYARGQKRFLMDRNAVWAAVKNYADPTLRRTLGPLLLLAARRTTQELVLHRSTAFARSLAPFSSRCRSPWTRLRDRAGGWPAAQVYDAEGPGAPSSGPAPPLIRRLPLEQLVALGEALGPAGLADVAAERHRIQRERVMSDDQVTPQLGRPFESLDGRQSYREPERALVDTLELREVLRGRRHVLIITHEPLRRNISGPGARVFEMAVALGETLQVTIATPAEPEISDPACTIAPYQYDDAASLRRLAEQADVIVVQGFTLSRFPWLKHLDTPVVVDLYCPFTLEHLEMTRRAIHVSRTRSLAEVEPDARNILSVQNEQLADGDFFICASERQLDFWLGALHTAGRVNPRTVGDDPTLRRLVDVVPFGIPAPAPPSAPRPASPLKGRHPGIGATDTVLLWGGLMGDWQDPQSVVRAVARLARERDDIRLFFMATKHPNPEVPPMRALEECRALARELDVLDTHVFFNDWVPYRELAGYLFDADIGLSTHGDHLETRFSFRARMRDYLWAGLPIVCTKGDYFGDLVEARGLGLTVPPYDVEALTDALRRLLADERLRQQCRANAARAAEDLRWSRVVEPLRRYCESPRFAPDREPAVRAVRERLERSFRVSKWLKRTALRLGVPEGAVERLKQTGVVRTAMAARNAVAQARARRGGS